MKKFFLFLIIIGAPWIILFKNDDPVGGMIAMFMQSCLIGWIPASIWAWRVAHPDSPKKKKSTIKVPESEEET